MTYIDIFLQYFILAFAIGIGWKWSQRIEEKAASAVSEGYTTVTNKVTNNPSTEDK